jgi:hypothetical protein
MRVLVIVLFIIESNTVTEARTIKYNREECVQNAVDIVAKATPEVLTVTISRLL